MPYDAHLIIDLCTLVVAIAGTYLASRRAINSRLAAIERTTARIEGALRNAGFKF